MIALISEFLSSSQKRLDELLAPKQSSKSGKLSSIEEGLSFQFDLSADELGQIVNFDKRNDKDQLSLLNSPKYDGVAGLAKRLKTDLSNGLKQEVVSVVQTTRKPGIINKRTNEITPVSTKKQVVDYEERQRVFGVNVLPAPPSETIPEIVWGNIKEDPIIKILLGGAAIVLTLGSILEPSKGWLEGISLK